MFMKTDHVLSGITSEKFPWCARFHSNALSLAACCMSLFLSCYFDCLVHCRSPSEVIQLFECFWRLSITCRKSWAEGRTVILRLRISNRVFWRNFKLQQEGNLSFRRSKKLPLRSRCVMTSHNKFRTSWSIILTTIQCPVNSAFAASRGHKQEHALPTDLTSMRWLYSCQHPKQDLHLENTTHTTSNCS